MTPQGISLALCVGASWSVYFALKARQPRPHWVLTQNAPRGAPVVIPHNPCPHCKGTGKSKCLDCNGRGRWNFVDEAILPKGVYPMWCRTCRGSGLWHCERCLGLGIKKRPIGLQL